MRWRGCPSFQYWPDEHFDLWARAALTVRRRRRFVQLAVLAALNVLLFVIVRDGFARTSVGDLLREFFNVLNTLALLAFIGYLVSLFLELFKDDAEFRREVANNDLRNPADLDFLSRRYPGIFIGRFWP